MVSHEQDVTDGVGVRYKRISFWLGCRLATIAY